MSHKQSSVDGPGSQSGVIVYGIGQGRPPLAVHKDLAGLKSSQFKSQVCLE